MMSQIGQGVETVYEERLVVFLDILGFKNLVMQSEGDTNKQWKMYEFLQRYSKFEHPKRTFSGFRKGDGRSCEDGDFETLKKIYDYRFTQFSDSFVFSVRTETLASVQYLPILIGQFMADAIDLGFLVRGGLAKGWMVHEEDGPVFGPAFNLAYKIESEQAIFGRVVLSKEAFGCISESGADSCAWLDKGIKEEYEIAIASFLRQKYSSPLPDAEKKNAALKKAIQKVEQMLGRLESPERDCVGEKYRYVISTLKHALDGFTK